MQTKQQPHSLLCVGVCRCIFACDCNHVIYETWMTEVASVTGETLSFFHLWNCTQTQCSHEHTLQCTGIWKHLEDKNASAFPLLYFIKSYHCTCCFGFTLGLPFIQSKICLCHSFQSLFWISQLHCLIAEPRTKTPSACLRPFYTLCTLSTTEHESIIQWIQYKV